MERFKVIWHIQSLALLPIVRIIGEATNKKDTIPLLMRGAIYFSEVAEKFGGRFAIMDPYNYPTAQEGKNIVFFFMIFENDKEMESFIQRTDQNLQDFVE